MPSAQIYLVLGPTGAGRRTVLADLVANGLDAAARPVLLTSDLETPASPEIEQRHSQVKRERWTIDHARFLAAIPADATHVFILTDGRGNPVDQIEAVHAWLPSSGGELARVITVVDCKLGHAHPELLRWYDACVHFSDVVLLARRDGVPNKWISDFVARYRKQHFPCLIEFVKRGELANPALILEPEARRVSQLFDETEPLSVAIIEGGEAAESDAELEDETGSETVVDEDAPPIDPYIERLAGSGRRAKEIPEIAKYL